MLWCIRSFGRCVDEFFLLREADRVRAEPGLGCWLGDCWIAEITAKDWLERATVAFGVTWHRPFQYETVRKKIPVHRWLATKGSSVSILNTFFFRFVQFFFDFIELLLKLRTIISLLFQRLLQFIPLMRDEVILVWMLLTRTNEVRHSETLKRKEN